MVWRKRENLKSLPLEASWIGLPILIVGAVVFLFSFQVKFHTLTHLSMLLILFGLVIFFSGWKFAKELALPIFFLLFMFPIPSAYYVLITNPLKLFITKISVDIIQLMGISVYREGNILFLSSNQLEVTEACSGIRSLYSYLMLGFLFAFFNRNVLNKIILVVSAIPLSLSVNILRVIGTGILSEYFSSDIAQGFFHQFTGLILFIFGFLFFLMEYNLLEFRVRSSA